MQIPLTGQRFHSHIYEEEHVDYREYRDFDDAFGQIKHWLEVVYMPEHIHQALNDKRFLCSKGSYV